MSYVPKHPTTGWMLSQLSKHGIHLRGTDFKEAQLIKQLRVLGYDVQEGSGSGGHDDDARLAPTPKRRRSAADDDQGALF